jgi:endonuclease/exonuclease/phosphatase (EEP) superfamily protein YafD
MIQGETAVEIVRALALALGVFATIATALPLLFPRAKSWQIRIFDFPRIQVAFIGGVAAVLALLVQGGARWPWALLPIVTLAAVVYQAVRIWRYSPLAPREVERSSAADPGSSLTLVLSNVLQENRDARILIRAIREADPDVMVFVETDEWWRDQLDVFTTTHPHGIQWAQSNTYGMCVYSRLPFEEAHTDFLVEPDVPSVQGKLRLPSGQRVWLNCVHPQPPAPGEHDSSAERDAELVLVARRVRDSEMPVIVCGDLNDVAWSRTTTLFQKISGLLDPRKGRGLYATFHAKYPFLRYPLDHIFHSPDFRLVDLHRLPYVGSDHFPVCVRLSHEPDAAVKQDGPDGDAEDEKEADETVDAARQRQARPASA